MANILPEVMADAIVSMLRAGVSERMTAEVLGVAKGTVARYRRLAGLPPGPRRRRYRHYRWIGPE